MDAVIILIQHSHLDHGNMNSHIVKLKKGALNLCMGVSYFMVCSLICFVIDIVVFKPLL